MEQAIRVQEANVAIDGSIQVENSTQVNIGNSTHFHGPVFIRNWAKGDRTGKAVPLHDVVVLPIADEDVSGHYDAGRVDLPTKRKTENDFSEPKGF